MDIFSVWNMDHSNINDLYYFHVDSAIQRGRNVFFGHHKLNYSILRTWSTWRIFQLTLSIAHINGHFNQLAVHSNNGFTHTRTFINCHLANLVCFFSIENLMSSLYENKSLQVYGTGCNSKCLSRIRETNQFLKIILCCVCVFFHQEMHFSVEHSVCG